MKKSMNRKYFSKQAISISLPNLIDIQKDSYNWLFENGIKELLDEINPIDDFTGKKYSLEFEDYELEEPKIDEQRAKDRNLSYKAPLKCRVKLVNKDLEISKGADVNAVDIEGMTPLLHAVSPEMAELLISKGADAKVKDQEGITAVMQAIANGINNDQSEASIEKTVTLLVSNGSDINGQNSDGMTVLVALAAYPKVTKEFIEFLISKGASTKIRDNKGKTALDYATEIKNTEIMSLLK